MDNVFGNLFNPAGGIPPSLDVFVVLIIIWSIIWKGSALWHSAKEGERTWFIAILIVNFLGLLEIAYLFFFSKNKINREQASKNVKEFFRSFSSKNPTKKR